MRSINASMASVLSNVKTVVPLPRSFIKSEQSTGWHRRWLRDAIYAREQRGFLRVTAETVADVAIIKRTRP